MKRQSAYHEGNESNDDNTQGIVQMALHGGKCLASDDAVEDQKSLHRENVQRCGKHGGIVSTQHQ